MKGLQWEEVERYVEEIQRPRNCYQEANGEEKGKELTLLVFVLFQTYRHRDIHCSSRCACGVIAAGTNSLAELGFGPQSAPLPRGRSLVNAISPYVEGVV